MPGDPGAGLEQAILDEYGKTEEDDASRGWAAQLAGQRLRAAGQLDQALAAQDRAADFFYTAENYQESQEQLTRAQEILKELKKGEEQENRLRLKQAVVLARLGQHETALKQVDDIAQATTTARESCYHLARLWAVSAAAERGEKAKEHADKAINWLKKAKGSGYFKDPRAVERLKKSKDFASLRSREEFKAFLQSHDG
jgi:tetratricopeptide (TPR) repeat protein